MLKKRKKKLLAHIIFRDLEMSRPATRWRKMLAVSTMGNAVFDLNLKWNRWKMWIFVADTRTTQDYSWSHFCCPGIFLSILPATCSGVFRFYCYCRSERCLNVEKTSFGTVYSATRSRLCAQEYILCVWAKKKPFCTNSTKT